MLEDLGPRQITLLGHVANENDRRLGLLGEASEEGGGLADLRYAARRAVHGLQLHDLNGVHDDDPRTVLGDELGHRFRTGFRRHANLIRRQLQTLGAQRQLVERLFAGHVENPAAPCQPAGNLQQQRALSRAGISTHQHDGAGHQAAAEHPVELGKSGGQTLGLLALHLAEQANLALAAGVAPGNGFFDGSDGNPGEGVPGAAGHALALPLGMLGAAVRADVRGFGFALARHQSNG